MWHGKSGGGIVGRSGQTQNLVGLWFAEIRQSNVTIGMKSEDYLEWMAHELLKIRSRNCGGIFRPAGAARKIKSLS